jgi:hypothetical protein
MALSKFLFMVGIILVSTNNLFGHFDTKRIESDTLKPSTTGLTYKDNRLEIDKYGNVVKDIDKGVLNVKYSNYSTFELQLYVNFPARTTNFWKR